MTEFMFSSFCLLALFVYNTGSDFTPNSDQTQKIQTISQIWSVDPRGSFSVYGLVISSHVVLEMQSSRAPTSTEPIKPVNQSSQQLTEVNVSADIKFCT